jgi:hypothetical protein
MAHPAAGRHLSLAELAELPHADVANPFVIDAIDAALDARGLHRRVRVVVVNVPALAELLAGQLLAVGSELRARSQAPEE